KTTSHKAASEPMADEVFIWDLEDDPEGNVQHIAEHDVTQEEVEEVLRDNHGKGTFSHSSGLPITFGWTVTGKYIALVYEEVDDDPLPLRPVTAYEVSQPADEKRRKRRDR